MLQIASFSVFLHFQLKNHSKTMAEIPGKMPEIPGTIAEIPGDQLLRILWFFFAFFWPRTPKHKKNHRWLKKMQGSFLSSSSTLGEALNLMSEPIDDVVGAHFDLDEEEKQLKTQLEANGSGQIQTLIRNMVFTRSIYPSWIFTHVIITPHHHNVFKPVMGILTILYQIL